MRQAKSVPSVPRRRCGARPTPETAASRADCVPEALTFRAAQKAVEHPVVGQQDVRRGFVHGPAGPNDVVRQHGGGCVRRFRVRVHAGRDPAPQLRRVPDAGCNAPGLILRQGIHGVDDDGLDARLVRVLAAPVENGQLEAFGLARTRAGGDDRGLRGVGLQSPEGFQLVGVGGVVERNRGGRVLYRCLHWGRTGPGSGTIS